jgi:hypothetical protein
MADLKLIALDEEDLSILSAHLQDAVVRVGDIVYEAPHKRFALLLNRFDWTAVTEAKPKQPYKRCRSGLRLERVSAVRSLNIDRSDKDAVLSLLAITFAPEEPPSGTVTLHFSGGMAIELTVECVEAELRDLGAAWATTARPRHPGIGSSGGNP